MSYAHVLLALGLALSRAEEREAVFFVDASLEPDGELLGGRFLDVDGDGAMELCMALEVAGGRELRFHRIRAARVESPPYRTVAVPRDVVAYAFADVREEPGDELLFLTRSGFHSLSLEKEGLQGNVRRLLEVELLFDVPAPGELPEWRFVLPSASGDRIVVPGRDGVSVWGPLAGPGVSEAAFGRLGTFPAAVEAARVGRPDGHGEDDDEPDADRTAVVVGSDGVRFQSTRDAETLRLPGAASAGFTLVSSRRSYGAPALVDVDGRGGPDLVFASGSELRIHLAKADGFSEEPDRREVFPDYLDREDARPVFHLRDLDGDGDVDAVAVVEEEGDGLSNRDVQVFVLRNDGVRLLPETPDQLLRFEAAFLRLELCDVDGDGRVDLALRKVELPGVVESLTGFELTLTQLVYLGRERGTPFERKPLLRQAEAYDESSIGELVANRELSMDMDGDGLADLVEVDSAGRVSIRRMRHSRSFFGGDSWSIERVPWKRFDVWGHLESIRVEDVNGDGVGDVVSPGSKSMTVLLSRKR